MNRPSVRVIILGILLLGVNFVFAQPGGGGPGGGGPPVPLGGIEILISAGLLYGIKKIRDKTHGNF